MKRGEHRNIISDDKLVWEHARARLGGVFIGKMQLVLGDESGSYRRLYEDLEGASLHFLRGRECCRCTVKRGDRCLIAKVLL